MFEPIDHFRDRGPELPKWMADDLGISRSTVLGSGRSRRAPRRRARVGRPFGDRVEPVMLFEGLSRRDLRVVSRLSTRIEVPAGTVLTTEGDAGSEFFVVLEGHVDVLRGDRVIATRGPGSPLGEVALLQGRPRTATLRARTPVSTRVASRREFEGLMAAVPEVSARLHAIMAEREAA